MFEDGFYFQMFVYKNNVEGTFRWVQYICWSDFSLCLTVRIPCSTVLELKMQQMQIRFLFAVNRSQAFHRVVGFKHPLCCTAHTSQPFLFSLKRKNKAVFMFVPWVVFWTEHSTKHSRETFVYLLLPPHS